MRFRPDPSLRRLLDDPAVAVVLGGSPLRMFRLTPGGAAVLDRVLAGDDVAPNRLTERLVATGALHPAGDLDRAPAASDFTAVVPAHDPDPQTLDRLVAMLRDAGVAEVVVVDDASRSPISVTGARVVRRAANGGPAAARNDGAAMATTPFVVFVDVDVMPTAGWLDPLRAHLADPAVAAVAPRVSSRPGIGAVARYERRHSPLDLGPDPALVAPGARVSYVPSAVVAVRRSALDAIGGFDPALRWGEDVDAVWRFVRAGHQVRYEPAATVTHEPRSSVGAFVRQRFSYGRSAGALAARHGDAVAPVRVHPLSVGPVAAAALGRWPMAIAALAGSTVVAATRPGPLSRRRAVAMNTRGALGALDQYTRVLTRAWWPIGVAALAHRRTRPVAMAAWARALAGRGALGVVDDVAYGTGVWAGAIGRRRLAPLLPVGPGVRLRA